MLGRVEASCPLPLQPLSGKANVGALAGQVRSQAAESNELSIQLEESVRSGRDQHREALKQDRLRRAEARRFSGGSSPLGPEPYDPAVEAWVRELADRGLLARPDKDGPPEQNESPADYFGRGEDYTPDSTQLTSVKGWVGYRRETGSFYATVIVDDDHGVARRLLSVGQGGYGRQYEFDEVVEALPMVDWAAEYRAVKWLADFAGLRLEELASLLPWDDRLRTWE